MTRGTIKAERIRKAPPAKWKRLYCRFKEHDWARWSNGDKAFCLRCGYDPRDGTHV